MNREIKFRGKRVDNGEWVYGYYVKDPNDRHRIYYQPFEDATSNTYHFVIPESVGQFTELKGYDGDIADVCIFLVSPENPDNDQHFRGVIYFENGSFVFTIHKYLRWDGKASEWIKLEAKHLPFYDVELDDDGTFTVNYFDFLAISGNLGKFCEDNIEIIGDIYTTPELLNQ